MYSIDEIEKKRLSAVALRQKKTQNSKSTSVQVPPANNVVNNIANNVVNNIANNVVNNNANNGFHQNKSTTTNWQKNSQWQKNKSGVFKQRQTQNRYDPIKSNKFYSNNKSESITGNCVMIQNNRFAVEVSKYHAPVVDIFKTIPSKSYDSQRRLWHFHLKDYNQLLEKLMKCNNCTITGLPKFTKQVFGKLLNAKKENLIDLSPIEETLRANLYPFQQDGIRFGISKKGRCMIADDMGLGKTIQALGIADYFKDDWPLLIVTPSSVRYQWSDAIYKYLPSIPMSCVRHYTKNEKGFEFDKVTIVSYDLLSRCRDIFSRQSFGFVIFDESHFLKNKKTVRFSAANEISAQANHVILLSGTPALSRPVELFSQISLISPNFMSYSEFGIRYCAGIQGTFGLDCSGSSNLIELDLLLKAFCLIRRIKAEVLHELPAKFRQVIMLDQNLINAGTKEMEEMAMKLQKKTLSAAEKNSAKLQYYSESSFAKQKAVCNYVSDLLEKGEKFLVYAHHQNVLDAICDILNKKKIKFIRIDGKTNPEQRKYFVDSFQTEKEILVAVLSIAAANAGITLTAAKLVVFAELTWNPGILCQAEDRTHRIGQDQGVIIQYLIARKTIDDSLWPDLQEKLKVLNKVGLEQEFAIEDNSVSDQIAIDSDQKLMDEFIKDDFSADTVKGPNLKPHNFQSPVAGSSTKQMKLDSFLSPDKNTKPEDAKNAASANNSYFASLLDEEDFCDVDFNEFP